MIGSVPWVLVHLLLALYTIVAVTVLRRSMSRKWAHPTLWVVLVLLWPLSVIVGTAYGAYARRRAQQGVRR